jgi:sugar-specific transcriptional regulator TrmB
MHLEEALPEQSVAALVDLGFTETEALTYCALVTAPGSTAYRLASMVTRSQSNVARALDGLIRKGAAVARKGNTRTYDPIPHTRLFDEILRRTEGQIGTASKRITRLVEAERERKAAVLAGNGQIFEMARDLLSSASETIAFVMSDDPLERLAKDLASAAERVKVAGVAFGHPHEIAGARIFQTAQSERLSALVSGGLMIMIADARKVLIMLEREVGGTPEFTFTDDPLLSVFFHNALVSDIILQSSDLIDEIISPNRHLFGMMPSAIAEIFRAN